MTAADEPATALVGAAGGAADGAMDEFAFERLYAATAGAIAGYLAAMTGRRDVADDLTQETFCRFLAQAPAKTAALDAESTRRYLFRIATNLLRDRWRAGEARSFEEPEEAGAAADLDAGLDARAMLAHLKPKESMLLWLAYVEGMDHAEIAAATGLGRLSVRTLLLRARRRAQQFLRPEGAER